MKRIICSLLTIVLIMAFMLPTHAAENISPAVTIYKYNDNTGNYDIPATSATSGDLLLVRIAFNKSVSSLASLRVKLEFPKDMISYVTGSFTPELVPGDINAGDPVFSKKDGYVTVFWGKGNLVAEDTSEFLGGTTAQNIASFVFCCGDIAGETTLKATIDNAMSADYKDIAMKAVSSTVTLAIGNWALTEEARNAFEKLETITYNPPTDSKLDIDAADSIYNSYTAAEKSHFANTYPELFEYYKTAWTRYYDASVEASLAEIKAEVERFRTENQEALALTDVKQVNDSNYELVLDAIEAYGKLTSQAQIQALDEKEQLDSLAEAAESIAKRIEADADAQTMFVDKYMNSLWNVDESAIDDVTYGDYMVIVAEAMEEYEALDHENLSDSMKEKVTEYYNKLKAFEEKIAEVAKAVGEDAAIQEEIKAFTDKWHVVTRLTALTVGIDDKTALEMFLDDFEKLSETAQTRLASRKSMAEQLLTYISGLNSVQGSTGNSNISVVPQGGTTTEVVKEVQVPVEKLITQVQSNSIFRDVPQIVYIMILLMGAAILTLPIPVIIYLIYRKNRNKLKGVKAE